MSKETIIMSAELKQTIQSVTAKIEKLKEYL